MSSVCNSFVIITQCCFCSLTICILYHGSLAVDKLNSLCCSLFSICVVPKKAHCWKECSVRQPPVDVLLLMGTCRCLDQLLVWKIIFSRKEKCVQIFTFFVFFNALSKVEKIFGKSGQIDYKGQIARKDALLILTQVTQSQNLQHLSISLIWGLFQK